MAAWLELARQSLRPHARRPHAWRARAAFALIFGAAGTWAAIAPQSALGLGDRLRLAFHAIVAVCLILAAAAGLRCQADIFATDLIPRRHRILGRLTNHFIQSLQDILPAVPFICFLLAIQAVGIAEVLQALACTFLLLAVSLCVRYEVSFAILLFYVTWGRNSFELTLALLFAFHLCAKALVVWRALHLTHDCRSNLMHEAITPMSVDELCEGRCVQLRRAFAAPIACLLGANVVFLCLILFGAPLPITLEQKVALGFALATGAALLLLDASALGWQGLLAGLHTTNMSRSFTLIFSVIIGVPWVAAWAFYAMHAGEAFTFNEGAAYFFLWIALGGVISWIARVSAKEKLHRELRYLLSEG